TNVPWWKVRSGQQNLHRAFPADGTAESSRETTKFDARGALAAFSFGPDLRVRADLLSKIRDLSDLWFWYVNCGRGDRRIARIDLATTAPGHSVGKRMKLLVISSWFPYPPESGAKLRAFHLLSQLAKSHDITLLSFAESGEKVDRGVLLEFCRDVQTVC